MYYCNYNTALLGEIIRRVSGRSLDDFFRVRIFEPLGMTNSYLVVPQEERKSAIRFPQDSEHGRWLCTDYSFSSQSPAGGAYFLLFYP